jgi:hypothetical protein
MSLQQQQALEAFIDQQKRKDTLKVIGEMVGTCFDNCVYNFRTRKLDSKEKLCLYQCTDKYFRFATSLARLCPSGSLCFFQTQQFL